MSHKAETDDHVSLDAISSRESVGTPEPAVTGATAVAVDLAVAAPAAMLAKRVLASLWKRVSGEPPPKGGERAPETSIVQTLAWATLAAVVATVTRTLIWRAIARRSASRNSLNAANEP